MNNSEQKRCILCIDDDPAMHNLLRHQLMTSGYHSLHVESGTEALQTLRDNHVDLIILDINIPKMDGFQLLRCLKSNQETENIPVIFLSSLSRENLKVKGLEYGADDFIVKPFTGPELMARLKAVIRRNTREKSDPKGIHGNLKELGIFELLHMLSFSRKNAIVSFPEMQGQIIVANSSILSAYQGSWNGKEALIRLFFMEDGAFTITDANKEGTELGGIESLLLFIGTSLDEINEQFMLLQQVKEQAEIHEKIKEFPAYVQDLIVRKLTSAGKDINL